MEKSELDQLRLCTQWFVSNHLPKEVERSVSIRQPDAGSNWVDVRVRANNAELVAIDTAIKFYAEEINPDIRLNFC